MACGKKGSRIVGAELRRASMLEMLSGNGGSSIPRQPSAPGELKRPLPRLFSLAKARAPFIQDAALASESEELSPCQTELTALWLPRCGGRLESRGEATRRQSTATMKHRIKARPRGLCPKACGTGIFPPGLGLLPGIPDVRVWLGLSVVGQIRLPSVKRRS